MRPSELVLALTALIPTRRPIWVHSAPGIGKSSLIRQVAETLGLRLIDLRTTLVESLDLRGLPRISENNITEWAPPVFLPREGSGLLYLDELSHAMPSVQAALLQLTLERSLGEYTLPPDWSIVASGNRAQDKAGTNRVISSLLNRFIHLELQHSLEDWCSWAINANIAPEVIAFLRFRPTLMFQFDPTINQRAAATPRSWQFVSEVLRVTPPSLLHQVCAGCVGDGPASEFISFLKMYQQLPDVDAVLANPSTAPVPREPAVIYSLISAMVERCRSKVAPVANFVRYSQRLPGEFAAFAIRDALNLDRSLIADKSLQLWIAQARTNGLFAAA